MCKISTYNKGANLYGRLIIVAKSIEQCLTHEKELCEATW